MPSKTDTTQMERQQRYRSTRKKLETWIDVDLRNQLTTYCEHRGITLVDAVSEWIESLPSGKATSA